METRQDQTLQSAQANRDGGALKWASTAAWTPNMIEALLQGRVKRGVWHALIDKVWKPENLLEASKKVLRNKGTAGVDHITCETFKANAETELKKIEAGLKARTYRPQAIKRVEIPKPGKREKRPLGIPTVRDRVVQTALKDVIEPIFDNEFLECSYGFRPGLGQMDALREVERLLKSGYCHVVDVDIRKFFDTIDHKIMMKEVSKKIADGRILELIEMFLKAAIMTEELKVPDEGTPQGGTISPLLANIYLHPLDKQLTGAGYRIVRYADDLLVLCRTISESEMAKELIETTLKALKLELNEEKTKIVNFNEAQASVEFLGYRFYRNKKGKIRRLLSKKSDENLRNNIRAITPRNSGSSFEEITRRLNVYMKGWLSYFKHCSKIAFVDAGSFIRRRLRTILRKRSKRHGQSKGLDHFNWSNTFLRENGYLDIEILHAELCSASR